MDKQYLADEIIAALKTHDKPRVSILRLVKNEIDTKEKAERRELSEDEITAALKKVLKQTAETLEGSIKVGTNQERTELLATQVGILESYLPRQITGTELEAIVSGVLAENDITEKREMGRAIGLVVAGTGGNCDKAEVARLVGSRLS